MTDTPNRVILLQLSDIEGGEVMQITNTTKRSQRDHLQKLARTLIWNFNEAIKLLEIPPSSPDLIVLNGDVAIKGKVEEFQVFEDIFLPTILAALKPASVVIVPGNHDVDRKKLTKALLANSTPDPGKQPVIGDLSGSAAAFDGTLDTFWDFVSRIKSKFTLVKWFTPPQSNSDPVEPCMIDKGFPVAVFPFSSSDLSGKLEKTIREELERSRKPKAIANEHYDVAVVKDFSSYEDACETIPSHSVRIAAVHHNSFPYPYDSRAELKQYSFVNGGELNNWLIKNRFTLLLHGHQHEGRVLRYADLRETTSPGCHDLLVVGTPAFGADAPLEFGFTITVIDGIEENAARIRICKVVPIKTATNFTSYPPEMSVATHYACTSDFGRKETLQKEINGMIVSGVFLDQLENLAERWRSGGSVDRFFSELREIRHAREDIKAMYSLSVFPPLFWTENRLNEFFLPEAKKNLAQAVSWAKSIEADLARSVEIAEYALRSAIPCLHFHFSEPLCRAIQNSNIIARTFGLTGKIKAALSNSSYNASSDEGRARAYVDRCISRHPENSEPESLSIWSNIAVLSNITLDDPTTPNVPKDAEALVSQLLRGRMTVDNMPVSLSQLAFYPNDSLLGADQSIVERHLCEFPRILLWDIDQFNCPEALRCIEFHEYCGFPLFWLDPDSLRNPEGNEREYEGHFTLVGRVKEENDYSAISVRNDAKGRSDPPFKTTFTERMCALWHGHQPRGLKRNGTLLEEYIWLLNRPDICLAADVWAVRNFLSADDQDQFAAHTRKIRE